MQKKHLIELLPDQIANQIAAGEVVQRPASVVKELLENAIDAKATEIELHIKNAGKTLIQVIDNGAGMSPEDARMSFERHATSKIRHIEDLFELKTMGFRGEALASIAAVAQVNMKTRPENAELGSEVVIEGGEIKQQAPCHTMQGTSIAVKNLFYNVPARRNFLKSNPVETRHILAEFTRIALAHPEIRLKLTHNDTIVYDLKGVMLEERIPDLLGKDLKGQLIDIEEETPYVTIKGLLGKPEVARKSRREQFFFVNDRFIKSGYLHHAVAKAYQELIPKDSHPFYCIFLYIDPKHIDVNIHPTKTEIKFDDERTVYVLLQSVVKKGVAGMLNIELAESPLIFNQVKNSFSPSPNISKESHKGGFEKKPNIPSSKGWETLYGVPEFREQIQRQDYTHPEPEQSRPPKLFEKRYEEETSVILYLKGGYIALEDAQGLLILDQHFAHQRVLYERFLSASQMSPIACQQMLFPQTLHFNAEEMLILEQTTDALAWLGFDLRPFGKDTYLLSGAPPDISQAQIQEILELTLSAVKEVGKADLKNHLQKQLAKTLAYKAAIPTTKKLTQREALQLVADWQRSEHPAVTPSGKPTFYQIPGEALKSHFKRKTD